MWFTAIDRVGAARSSLYANLQPFLGAIWALLILSETMTWLQVVGGVVIAGGIFLATRPETARAFARLNYPRLMAERALILDFDGTITEQDLLDAIATHFGDEDVFAELEVGLLGGDLPLHEVIRREFAPVKAPLGEVVDWVLANAKTRAGFVELIREARERGYEVDGRLFGLQGADRAGARARGSR